MAFESLTVDVPGGEIFATRRDRDAPPALVLHGGPGMGAENVVGLVEELDGLFETAVPQQRGLAPSTLEGPRDVETHVADAVAVLDQLAWDRPWLIGHSWGGHLAKQAEGNEDPALMGKIFMTLWPSYSYIHGNVLPPNAPRLEIPLPDQPDTMTSVREHFDARTLERTLPGLDLPALLIHGEGDPMPMRATTETARSSRRLVTSHGSSAEASSARS